MVKVVRDSVADVDAVMLLVEPIPHVGGPEEELIERIKALGVPSVLVIHKIDTVKKDELLAVMATKLEQQHYDMIALMVTDVLLEGTSLLYIGNDDTIRAAFSVEPKDSAVFLPGVMSRKKQIIPMLTALWG